jgi:hypothetical protein
LPWSLLDWIGVGESDLEKVEQQLEMLLVCHPGRMLEAVVVAPTEAGNCGQDPSLLHQSQQLVHLTLVQENLIHVHSLQERSAQQLKIYKQSNSSFKRLIIITRGKKIIIISLYINLPLQ